MTFTIDPKDYNYTCYIVAGGPSLSNFDWSLLTPDKFVIAINRAYEVLPNAQIVYFTDKDYWERHKDAMLQHKGQLMRGILPNNKEQKHPDVQYWELTGPHGYETNPGCLRHGSNSTHAVLNMVAAHLGFKKVYLLGVDMKWGAPGNKNTSHWHDGHARIDHEAVYKKMIKSFELIAPELTKAGVEVYNCNPDSALNVFPKIRIEEIL